MLRFVPNITEDMNINSLRIAILNYMVSIQENENLVIRIEDTNKDKKEELNTKKILEILNLFSINYKHIVTQSDHIKYHSQFAMQLLMDRKAFNCFCGDDILQKEKDEAKEQNIPYVYSGFCENLSDAVTFECEAPFTVRIKKESNDSDSFIILNHDKTPTYNFACAIDDMLSDISTVIRSEDHLDDTTKQIYIRKLIGYDKEINYIHIPKISNGDVTIQSLIDDGYLPSAITNYLILLSTNNDSNEIFTLEEALKWFDITKLSNNNQKFDIEKLKLINKEHLKSMDELRLSKILGYSDKDIGSLAKVYLQECDTIVQIKEKINNIFKDKVVPKEHKENCNIIVSCLKDAPYIKEFEEFKKYISSNTKLENESLEIALRYILTNTNTGPKMDEIYPFIRNYLGEII